MSDTCRTCQQPVMWAITEYGRSIPLDPEPSVEGNVIVRGNPPVARVEHEEREIVIAAFEGVLFNSHFATCPDAETHRRRRSRKTNQLGIGIATLLIAVAAWGGVAWGQAEPEPPPSPELVRYITHYQGKPVRWWARRAVQARKDANKRGLTIARLKRQNLRLADQLAGRAPFFALGIWDRLADTCESPGGQGQWSTYFTTGNGFYFRLQFHPRTWDAYRGSYSTVDQLRRNGGRPPAREQQIVVAERVLAAQGWGAWPACSRKLGLR